LTLLGTGILCLSIMLLTYLFPQVVLWVLGPQYRSLRFEVQIAIASGAVSFFSSVLWGIHSARRFVYWWNVGLSIASTLLVQILFVVKGDVGSVRGVLMLNLAMNTTLLLVNVLSGAYGFLKGPRVIDDGLPLDTLSQQDC